MAEQIAIGQRLDASTAINSSMAEAVENFVETATYAAPEVVSFPLNGLRISEATSLTGNTG
jgi:hypothetical protein